MEEKRIAAIVGDAVHDMVLERGMTPADLRRRLGLPPEFMLSPRQGLPFGEHERLFERVRDGDKIFASPPATVGQTPGRK